VASSRTVAAISSRVPQGSRVLHFAIWVNQILIIR
jgi:hypothetical protein